MWTSVKFEVLVHRYLVPTPTDELVVTSSSPSCDCIPTSGKSILRLATVLMSYHSDVFVGDDDGGGAGEEEEEEEEDIIEYEERTRLAETPETKRRGQQREVANLTSSPSSSRGSGSTPGGGSRRGESSPKPRRSSRKQGHGAQGWGGLHSLYSRFTRIFHKAWRDVRFRGESLHLDNKYWYAFNSSLTR